MITFKQYLLVEEGDREEPINLYKFLRKHCQPFLTECDIHDKAGLHEIWDDAILYRGIKTAGMPAIDFEMSNGDKKLGIFKGTRKDRIPKDTHPELTKLVDDKFEEEFGWRPRTEGVFCFGQSGRRHAADYGDVYRIFPMGEIKYVWSPEVYDLTMRLSALADAAAIRARDKHDPHTKEELEKYAKAFSVKDLEYKDTDLDRACKQRNEIMLDCKSYLAIKT
jgi:hypothetical protein